MDAYTGEQRFGKDGRSAGGWSEADDAYYRRDELPPAVKQRKHAACVAAAAKGECCELDADPPPTATICRDGPAR